MLQLLWKMQLQIEYTPVKLKPHVHVPEEPGEFHPQEAAECHQEGGEPHQVLATGVGHLMDPFQSKNCRNKDKLKTRNTCDLILCGVHCMYHSPFCSYVCTYVSPKISSKLPKLEQPSQTVPMGKRVKASINSVTNRRK
jgi:hypothetical protein